LEQRLKETQGQEAAFEFRLPEDPVKLVESLFGFTPKEYQASLLEDSGKRIVVRWSRQAGKTTCTALRAIWFALTHPKTLTLIVAPSLRQSIIMSDRIQDFLMGMSKEKRSGLVDKMQRTTVRFKNGSRIVALPNSPQLLRGYTANQVIADEAGFFREDKLVFYNVLYPMLSTTDGALIASSTPWSKDSVFYRMCQSPEFSKHVTTCEDVVRSGLIKQGFIDEMRAQLPFERFQREFMAEFVEDADAWLSQSLIVSCIDGNLQPYDFQDAPQGEFYVGVDFGKHQDFSVVLVVQKAGQRLRVVHVKRFPLRTQYASVIGYVKSLADRWHSVREVYADTTGVGDYIVEDMRRSGLMNVTGVLFTIASKEEMATILRETMRRGELQIPYVPTSRVGDVDLTAELNVEKSELLKTGHIRFTHPEAGHDDVFWAAALAVYASRVPPAAEVRPMVDTGKVHAHEASG
jgi:phage FluMu gp28-like protein